MNFLVDAQLPKTLSLLLAMIGHDSIHTLDLPDKNLIQDNFLLQLAEKDGRVIITKDLDFLESQLITGEPKKLILVKTGNIKDQELLNLFKKNRVNG
jgi:predicted nuclease of predicted toxin-antitoxin system